MRKNKFIIWTETAITLKLYIFGWAVLWAILVCFQLDASDRDETKIKRQEIFEFTQKPTVKRNGNNVEISFESKGFCDVTVAIENAEGKILRHLVSGVLGPKAPEPFQKDSLKQSIIWDGKDDRDKYCDEVNLNIRVSLGLKPQFEKTLFWEPKKRWSEWHPIIQPAPEGIYVFDNANGVPQLRLFDHEGNYIKTVYPFPANKLEQVLGLNYHLFPQSEKPMPLRNGSHQVSFLSSGLDSAVNAQGFGVPGGKMDRGWYAVNSMAIFGDNIALANRKINRLAKDGSTGGLSMEGPEVAYPHIKQ